MANYTQLIQALIVSVNQRITSKNTTDSIDPVDVGGSITDTLNTLLPILNTINNFDILKGNGTPTNGQGVDGDIYIQDGSIFAFYKKVNGAWVSKAVIDLGITFPDGNISLQSRIKQNIVTVSSGAWFIGNVKYQKSVQTQFTVPSADANFDRIDAIFANSSNNVVYVSGTASANPDTTQPTTPANTVLVNYVYVPKSSSNQLPYISDSNFQDDTPLVVTSSATDPVDGSDGDLYFQIPSDNSFLKLWQKVSGTWQAIFDLPIGQGGGGTSTVIHRSFTIPESDIVDGVVSLTGRTNDQGDQIIPVKATWAVETEDGSVGRYSNRTQTIDGLGLGRIELYLVGVEALFQGKRAVFIGNSITQGYYAEPNTSNGWAYLVCKYFGMTCLNNAQDATMARDIIPQKESKIPLKQINDRFLFFDYGVNEGYFSEAGYTIEQYKQDYSVLIDYALSVGWTNNEIIFNVGYYTENVPQKYLDIVQATIEIAESYNFNYTNMKPLMNNSGGNVLLHDFLHPNQSGHNLISNEIKDFILQFF